MPIADIGLVLPPVKGGGHEEHSFAFNLVRDYPGVDCADCMQQPLTTTSRSRSLEHPSAKQFRGRVDERSGCAEESRDLRYARFRCLLPSEVGSAYREPCQRDCCHLARWTRDPRPGPAY